MASKPTRIIITGYSGAGLSSVLKALEDFGYEVFDNMPLSHIDTLIKDSAASALLAFGVDTRTRGFNAEDLIKAAHKNDAFVVFITCEKETLLTRFTQTRRRHPLAKTKTARFGIEKEAKLLKTLSDQSDLTIDTTHLSVHDLRHILESHFQRPHNQSLNIHLMSFGYKFGLPREADIVMDVRFLQNPHWEEKLRPLTGLDKPVGTYIKKDPDFENMLQSFQALIEPLLKRYIEEGKYYLTIAFGCTGGRHRSVYTVETLKTWLDTLPHQLHIEHRDIKK